MSEFTILRGIFAHHHLFVGLLVLLFLALVFIGMGSTVLAATQGKAEANTSDFRDRLLLCISPTVFMLLVLLLGVYIPEPLQQALQNAAALLEVHP